MSHPTTPLSGFEPDWFGQFTTFETWVGKASSWIDKNAVCVDAKGRRCLIGKDFMRARDESAFPVRFFWTFKELGSLGERDSSKYSTKTPITADAIGPGGDPPGYVIPIPEEIPFRD